MNLFGFDITRKKATPPTHDDRVKALEKKLERAAEFQLAYLNGSFVPYDPHTKNYIRHGYMGNPHVYSIVSRIIEKAVQVPFSAYKVKSEKALKSYRAGSGVDATPESVRGVWRERVKALEDLPDTAPTAVRLARPSDELSLENLVAEATGFWCLSGEFFLCRSESLSVGTKGLPLFLDSLPPQLVDVVQSGTWRGVKEYRFTPLVNQSIDPARVVHKKRWNPDYDGATWGRGLSPLRALLLTVQSSNESQNAKIRGFINQGPPVVVFPKVDGAMIDDTEVTTLRDAFKRYAYGRQKGQIMVQSMPLEKLELGLSAVDLEILNSELFDRQTLANAYGYDALLLGNTEGRSGTAAELADARRSTYLSAVRPALVVIREALNEAFGTAARGEYIDFDDSKLPEMAEDELKKAQALGFQSAYVTNAEKRAHMGWDADTRAEYQGYLNDYMVPSSETPYLELQEAKLAGEELNTENQTDIPE